MAVVNIDNGFGAGYVAAAVNRRMHGRADDAGGNGESDEFAT